MAHADNGAEHGRSVPFPLRLQRSPTQDLVIQMQFIIRISLLSVVVAVVAAAALPSRIGGLAIRGRVDEAAVGFWRRTQQTIIIEGKEYTLEKQPTRLHPKVYHVVSSSPLVAIKYDQNHYPLRLNAYRDVKYHGVLDGAKWIIRDGPSSELVHFTKTPEYEAVLRDSQHYSKLYFEQEVKKLIQHAAELAASKVTDLGCWRYTETFHLNDFLFNLEKHEVYVLWLTAIARRGAEVKDKKSKLQDQFWNDWQEERRLP